MFQLLGIAKHYAQRAALRGVDLDVSRGRTLVLLGPSGCGKSTLLKVMLGLVRPDRGEVRFAGERIDDAERARLLRRRMGYVVQGGGLFPHLTVRANVTLMA